MCIRDRGINFHPQGASDVNLLDDYEEGTYTPKLRFSNNLRFRAAFDFFLLRHSIEPNLKNDIEWWTEFRTANYDKKIKLLNSRGRKFAKN